MPALFLNKTSGDEMPPGVHWDHLQDLTLRNQRHQHGEKPCKAYGNSAVADVVHYIFFPKKSICSAQDQFVYILSKVAEGEEELGAPELPCLKKRVVKNAANAHVL